MYNKFDFICWEIERKMRQQDGGPNIEHSWALYPVQWYVATGRAPTDFLIMFNNMTERQKSTVARRLLKTYRKGKRTYDDSINTVCDYLGFVRNPT